MNNSNIVVRSLLTLGLIIGTINFMTYFFPTQAQKMIGSFESLNTFNTVGKLVYMITFVVLMARIWKNQYLDKTAKGQWTILIILLPIVLGTYYLWVKEKQAGKS